MKEPLDQYKPAEKLELKDVKKSFPKVFKKISCPSCEQEVSASNLSLQNNMAKCDGCNVMFSIEEEVNSLKEKSEIKKEYLRPEGIDLFYFKDDLSITAEQRMNALEIMGVILVPFFALIAILLYFKKGIPMYYPGVLSIWSAYLIHRTINYSENKIHIDVNDKFLSIKPRPKNFRKDKMYDVAEIDQLYIKNSVDGSGYFTIYMIINGVEGQNHQKLITINTLSKAKYLEQEIELYLGIKDRKVPEENV